MALAYHRWAPGTTGAQGERMETTQALRSLAVVLAGGAISAASHAAAYTYTTVLEPGASATAFWDIGNAGTIVGYSHFGPLEGGAPRGFVYSGGVFTPLTGPSGAIGTYAMGLSDSGTVVGSYYDTTFVEDGLLLPGPQRGFVYTAGSYATFDVPGATDTQLRAISPDGRYLTGFHHSALAPVGQGFVYDTVSNAFTLLGAGGYDLTIAQGVNDAGIVVGSDRQVDEETFEVLAQIAFTYDATTGIRTDVALPGTDRTSFRAISAAGVVTGWTRDAAGTVGFSGWPGALTPIAIAGAADTFAEGSNDAGTVVGNFRVGDIAFVAFIATPVPEPAGAALLVAGLMVLALRRRRPASEQRQ
jgi:uncharacterized membrane protein